MSSSLSTSPTIPTMAFYALSPQQALYVFVGFTESHAIVRCQNLGLGQLVQLPEHKQHRLWNLIPRTVQYFISNEAPRTALGSLLPKEKYYRSISHITFTLVELPKGQRFAEDWMQESRRLLLALSQGVQCHTEVENASHVIRISPLAHFSVHVDVACSSSDVGALYRVSALTQGNDVELSVNIHDTQFQQSTHHLTPYMVPLSSFSQPDGVLPSLRKLTLSMSPENALQMLQGTCTTTLKSLTIYFPSLTPSRHSNLTDLANLLTQRCRRSLKTLHIYVRDLHPYEQSSWRNISAFQTLTSLETFSFEHPLPFSISAQQVQTLLESWKHAVSISLNPRAVIPRRGAHLSDMNVLVAVRRYAPSSLRHFGVTIDPDTAPRTGYPGVSIRSSCHLESLDIGACRIADEFRVVPLVTQAIFQTLRKFKHGPGPF